MNVRQCLQTDDPQFVRDRHDGAILNIDNKALDQYKRIRAESLAIKQVVQEVADLRHDLNEIKELLRKLASND